MTDFVKRTPIPLYSSFGKSTNDFFSKSFPATTKVELSTSTENGVNFVSSAEKKTNKDGSEFILGSQQIKYKNKKYNVDGSATITTDNQVKAEATVSGLGGISGLKVLVKPQVGKSNEVPLSLEFQNDTVSCTSSLLWKTEGDLLVSATGVLGRKGFSVGLSTDYYLKHNKDCVGWEAITGLVNYKADNHDFTVFAKNQFNTEVQSKESPKTTGQKLSLGSRLQYKAASDLTVHASVDFDTTKSLNNGVSCVFGGTYLMDKDTVTHAKLDTAGKLGLSLTKQVTPRVKFTATSELDSFTLAHASNHKFTVGLNISA